MDEKNTSPANSTQGGGPVMDVQAPKAATSPASSAAQTPAAANNKPLKAPKAGKTPIGVILVAILVGLSLCGLTVFAYMKTKDTPVTNNGQNTQTQQKATSGDVDDTTDGIDESLKSVDDAQDFNDTDLSDTNLGL